MADDNFYREPIAKLSQGDILVTPHLRVSKTDTTPDYEGLVTFTATGRPALGVVMNFDCEIDKPWSLTVVVCPIVPLSELKESQRADAKRNRIAHLVFMPRYRDVIQDSVAILNQQTTLEQA